jgi:hypothetical protein
MAFYRRAVKPFNETIIKFNYGELASIRKNMHHAKRTNKEPMHHHMHIVGATLIPL